MESFSARLKWNLMLAYAVMLIVGIIVGAFAVAFYWSVDFIDRVTPITADYSAEFAASILPLRSAAIEAAQSVYQSDNPYQQDNDESVITPTPLVETSATTTPTPSITQTATSTRTSSPTPTRKWTITTTPTSTATQYIITLTSTPTNTKPPEPKPTEPRPTLPQPQPSSTPQPTSPPRPSQTKEPYPPPYP